MAPNEEIKQIMLDCKSKGLNSMEVLQLMEIPYELTDYSYLFDFGPMPIEELSTHIDYILRMRWYLLDREPLQRVCINGQNQFLPQHVPVM